MTPLRGRQAGFPPEAWGLAVTPEGSLAMQSLLLSELAREFGTPLHVLDVNRLREGAARLRGALLSAYHGAGVLHYAMKANNSPAVVALMRGAGLAAEVMTEYELWLALRSGYVGNEIIANGPCKTVRFLAACIDARVKAIIVDSLPELQRILALAEAGGAAVPVLLRINPDFVPRHMNAGSATAWRAAG